MFATSWKIINELKRHFGYLPTRLLFFLNNIHWGREWRIYGLPIIQKHKESKMALGSNLQLRSFSSSNPLSPYHRVMLVTWKKKSLLEIGDHFGMTGGTICSSEFIKIGNRVTVGANTIIIDSDFHPLPSDVRQLTPQEAITAPVIIEDDVFIGLNCIILKGVTIGRGSIIGAGSVVTHDVPSGVIVAGNPAEVIKDIS